MQGDGIPSLKRANIELRVVYVSVKHFTVPFRFEFLHDILNGRGVEHKCPDFFLSLLLFFLLSCSFVCHFFYDPAFKKIMLRVCPEAVSVLS